MLDWPLGERTAGQDGTWEMDPVVSTALYWRYSVTVGRESAAALAPGLYHELRYEDLVASPRDALERIAEFLRIPYAEAMARFYESASTGEPGLSSDIDLRSLRLASGQWLPPIAGLRDWRTQLPSRDAERIEAAAGDLLGGLGYARSSSRPSPAILDHVARVHEAFTSGLIARGRPVPRDW
jgi:hypothetical protein